MTGPVPVPRPPRPGAPTGGTSAGGTSAGGTGTGGTGTGSTDSSGATAPAGADEPRFDELLSRLDGLDERPVGEHHDRLAEVHESLHAALHQPPTG